MIIHNIHLVHYLWRRELILILPRPTARRAISRRRQELPELRASSSSAAWARCAAWLSAGGSRTQSGGRCKGGGDGIALDMLSHMSFYWMEGMSSSREHKWDGMGYTIGYDIAAASILDCLLPAMVCLVPVRRAMRLLVCVELSAQQRPNQTWTLVVTKYSAIRGTLKHAK